MGETGNARERMLEAVVAILLEEGFEGLSIRKVATAAGTSIGAVQHHFATKTDLLTATVEAIGELAEAEITQALSVSDDPAERLRAFCATVAGLTDPSRSGSQIYLLWLARSITDAAVAERHQCAWQQLEGVAGQLLREASGGAAELVADEAALLLSVLDGLAYAVATEPVRMPIGRAARLLDAHLEAVHGRLG